MKKSELKALIKECLKEMEYNPAQQGINASKQDSVMVNIPFGELLRILGRDSGEERDMLFRALKSNGFIQ